MVRHSDPNANVSSRFGVIVLANSGRRSGSLPHYLGRSLIEHVARVALSSGATEVIVVVGSDSISIKRKLQGLPVRIVACGEQSSGLGDAIATGVAALSSSVESVVITLGNRPGVTSEHLSRLASGLSDDQTIVASEYGGVAGVPCAFSRAEFPNLQSLSGNEGARELVRSRCTARINFEAARLRLIAPPAFLAISSDLPVADVKAPTFRPLDSRAPPSRYGHGVIAHPTRRNASFCFALEPPCLDLKHSPLLNSS